MLKNSQKKFEGGSGFRNSTFFSDKTKNYKIFKKIFFIKYFCSVIQVCDIF